MMMQIFRHCFGGDFWRHAFDECGRNQCRSVDVVFGDVTGHTKVPGANVAPVWPDCQGLECRIAGFSGDLLVFLMRKMGFNGLKYNYIMYLIKTVIFTRKSKIY